VLYLANPCGPAIIEQMRAGRIGLIDTPLQYMPTAVNQVHEVGGPWCADNSCFGVGYPGDSRWFRWLCTRLWCQPSCLFAAAPDVVGDGVASLARSRRYLGSIRDLGFPVALVAQDGMERLDVPWDDFDVLFIGGTTEWKDGPQALALARQAQALGKRTHLGRVNGWRRYRYALQHGFDSVDGTLLTFAPDQNLAQLQTWIRNGERLERTGRLHRWRSRPGPQVPAEDEQGGSDQEQHPPGNADMDDRQQGEYTHDDDDKTSNHDDKRDHDTSMA
jgi:hypothetical protein